MKSDNMREEARSDGVKLIPKTHTLNEAEYLVFKKRCEKDGFSASQILRAFIKSYRSEEEK